MADTGDEVLDALDALVAAIAENAEVNKLIRRRARQLRGARAKGRSWGQIAGGERRPLIVEMLRANQDRLSAAGSAFRRAEAAALRREGFTLDEIAGLFGVTRPRVVALLRVEVPGGAVTGPRRSPA